MSRQIFIPKSKVINGVTYKVAPFPAVEALKLKAHLVKILGPALGRLIGSIRGAGDVLNAEVNGIELAGALDGLMSQLGEDAFVALIKRMLGAASCEIPDETTGKPVMISFASDFDTKLDLVFQGRLFDVYPVLAFVLEVNYPDFFGKLGGIGAKLQTLISRRLGSASDGGLNESAKSESSTLK